MSAGVFGVVEDQQPPVPVTQLGQHPVHHLGGDRVGGQPQPGGQTEELLGDKHRLFGVDPPHQVVIVGVPVRVFDDQLGLADATQPVQGLHRQSSFRLEPPTQLIEQVAAADEMRVPGRHVPDVSRANRSGRCSNGWRRRCQRGSRIGGAGFRGVCRLCSGGCGCVIQVRVLREHGCFQLLQRPARFDTQLIGERPPGTAVGLQRVGLPP